MALDSVREYKHGLLKLERRGDRYVPLNITTNNDTVITNATIELELPPEVNEQLQNMTNLRNNVCIQNNKNETICYKFGKFMFNQSNKNVFL